MNATDWIEPLERAECLHLLATVPVGRVVFTEMAMPAAYPVNFVVVDDGIVFRTKGGGILDAAVRDAVVGFEADHYDVVGRSGWSVLVVGPATETTDLDSRSLMSLAGPWPWNSDDRDRLFKIRYGRVSGRRVGELVEATPA